MEILCDGNTLVGPTYACDGKTLVGPLYTCDGNTLEGPTDAAVGNKQVGPAFAGLGNTRVGTTHASLEILRWVPRFSAIGNTPDSVRVRKYFHRHVSNGKRTEILRNEYFQRRRRK